MARAMVSHRGSESEDVAATVQLLPAVFRCEKRSDGRIHWTLSKGWLAEELHLASKRAKDRTLEELFPEELVPRLRAELERAFAGVSREFSYELGNRTLRQYAQPVRDSTGAVVSIVGFIFEMAIPTDEGSPLRSLYERMTEHVVEIAMANRQVLEANRELEAFGYMVAHDLRSPLVLLDSALRSLLTTHAAQLNDAAKEEVNRGRQTVGRMTQIIDDLLRFSRTGRGGVEPEEVDLSALVGSIVHDLALTQPARTVEVEIRPDATVKADARLLRIAMENLLRNAWKFTKNQVHAKIEFGWTSDATGQRVFYLRDNGAGFDPARAHKLFQPFERLHPQSEFKGTGVGLSSVRRIMGRHGGRIWAEGAPGRGATFFFTLPDGARRPRSRGEDPTPSTRPI